MLVLSRKRDEKVVIGGSVEVTVVEIRGDKVRLGIEAPKDVPVHREEVARVILRKGGSLAAPIEQPSIRLRPASEWHEDLGPVLWWVVPTNEPPIVANMLDDDIEAFFGSDDELLGIAYRDLCCGEAIYTHWCPLPNVEQPT